MSKYTCFTLYQAINCANIRKRLTIILNRVYLWYTSLYLKSSFSHRVEQKSVQAIIAFVCKMPTGYNRHLSILKHHQKKLQLNIHTLATTNGENWTYNICKIICRRWHKAHGQLFFTDSWEKMLKGYYTIAPYPWISCLFSPGKVEFACVL